ncbi:hypothetical protein LC612_31060 [Nostoc sp. CHAB 5834]|nr:hypothetical protein [Nostoc sp. CHAB 5834]
MLFSVPLTPKNENLTNLKLAKSDTKIEIPDSWADFARKTDIKTTGGIRKFIPYGYQLELVKILEQYPSAYVLKSRQLGISETVVSYMTYNALKSRGYTGLVFSRFGEDSAALGERSKLALESYGVKLDKSNASHIMIKGGGDLKLLNSSENGSRGTPSVSHCLYDEAAFNERLKGIREATLPSQSLLGSRAREWFVSTPDSPSGYYYELINRGNTEEIEETARKVVEGTYPPFYWYIDQNGNAKVFIHFKAHPEYSQNKNFLIEKKEKHGFDEAKLRREYNLAFTSPANEYFTREELKLCHRDNLKIKRGVSGDVYIGALDPNNGGKDYTVFSIWRVKNGTFSKVFGYRANFQNMEYHLEKINALILRFSNMVLIVESNAHGKNWFDKLFDAYPSKTIYECNITANNKEAYIHRLKYHIESQKIFIEPTDKFNLDALNLRQTEITNLVTGALSYRYAARDGANDDEIMAASIMLEAASRKGWIANTLCD